MKRLRTFLLTLTLALVPRQVLAGVIPEVGSSPINQSTKSITEIVGGIVPTALLFLSALAGILLLIAGIQYISSAGNPEGAKKARQNIINIIIALVLILTAYSIIGLFLAISRYLASQAVK